MPENNGSYFSRSVALLKQDPQVIKTAIICGLACLIPFIGIVGAIGVSGFLFEWARLVAWGVDTPPKRDGVDIGNCLMSGFRVFVVTLVIGAIASLLMMVLTFIPLVNIVAVILATPFSIAVSVISAVAALRATIYQSFDAGLNYKRIKELVEYDTSGLLKIGLISLLGVIALVIGSMILLIPVGSLLVAAEDSDAIAIITILLMLLWVAVVIVACMFFAMVFFGAIALWMRQFNVPAWGGQDDPLPFAPTPAATSYAATTQGYQQGYAQPGAYAQQPMAGYQDPQAYAAQQVTTQPQQMPAEYQAQQYAQQTVPQQQYAQQAVPQQQVAPQQATPVAMPVENVPVQNAPVENAPAENAMSENALVEAQPSAVPAEEAPTPAEEGVIESETAVEPETVEAVESVATESAEAIEEEAVGTVEAEETEAIEDEAVEAVEVEVAEAVVDASESAVDEESTIAPEPTHEEAVVEPETVLESVAVPEAVVESEATPEITADPTVVPEAVVVEKPTPEPEAAPEPVVVEPIVIEDIPVVTNQPEAEEEADEKDTSEE